MTSADRPEGHAERTVPRRVPPQEVLPQGTAPQGTAPQGTLPRQEELPFFVYGTLRPGEVNHDLFLRGRTAVEEPARLPDAALYEGPGYPYAVDRPGSAIAGELITPAPGAYGELLVALDLLEEYAGPGHPANVYDRTAREALRPDGTPVRAWVYLAAPSLARRLARSGTPIPGGDWLRRG